MATQPDASIFLPKKLLGMLLILVGLVVGAIGVVQQSGRLTVGGIILLAAGALLLALKIVRRNQPDPR
ncbi:MAG: hypothetical protein J7500_16265 [Sphingomonas sp.]|uniref:hypothetical protein n=1 Tax=Sphingomonas sp. TaxID=28214 RepID=UPI001B0890C6|nr:hypothetical protein [Sphingomonas sp.]MBO9624264.1 hypothetical protein [Sphingomonas sp.]